MKVLDRHFRENYSNLLPRYTKFLNSKERAEDVIQEAYCRCATYWSDAPADDREFGKWFSTILGNCLKENHRDEIMKGATNDKDSGEERGVESAAIPAIIYRQVVERINAKPEGQARVLSLALLHQYRPGDIEAIVPENAVAIRKTISRFRAEIKKEFGWNI